MGVRVAGVPTVFIGIIGKCGYDSLPVECGCSVAPHLWQTAHGGLLYLAPDSRDLAIPDEPTTLKGETIAAIVLHKVITLMFPRTCQAKDGRLIIVRPAETGDTISIIANINVIAAEEIYLQTDSFIQTPSWKAALSESNDPQAGLLLVVPVIDCAVIGHLRVFPGDYGARDRHVGSIGVALLPPYRGIGIGTALLGCALDWTLHAGFGKLEAYVVASNLRARWLFEKFGFAVEGLRQQQLKIRDRYEDELILARPVQAAWEQSLICASREGS